MKKADEEDFLTYVADRMDRWRRSAYLLCQDWHTADDIVSVTVTKLFRDWRRAGRADNRDAYAQKILTRSFLDELRRPWRRESPWADPAAGPVPVTAAHGWTDDVTEREALATLLSSLGPRQRAVIVLRFYLDYSVGETAKLLDISEGTVKSQSARGLEAVRTLAESLHR